MLLEHQMLASGLMWSFAFVLWYIGMPGCSSLLKWEGGSEMEKDEASFNSHSNYLFPFEHKAVMSKLIILDA